MNLLISFRHENVRLGTSRWLFARRQRMRFEWLALLAFTRVSNPSEQSWVGLADIARLPSWAGRRKHDIGTNLGRYLQAFERAGLQLVHSESRWAGPYRLAADPTSISFDIPLAEVKGHLRIRGAKLSIERDELYQFTKAFILSQRFVSQGKLLHHKKRQTGGSAYSVLLGLMHDKSFNPRLRLFAGLASVQVLFRIGKFVVARKELLNMLPLLRNVSDKALKAQLYLALAWSYQRATTSSASDREVENAIRTATAYAEVSGDRHALGLVGHRMGLFLTKKGEHLEAVNHLLSALEVNLIIGNHEMVQATCGNIGSVLHRLGRDYYSEARRWLLLGMVIARWVNTGHDDAHGEMILGKIHVENGNREKAYWLLKRAERIAKRAGNQVGVGDVKMVWGFWHQRFGTRASLIKTLTDALRVFGKLGEFDRRQKERYINKEFPEVCPELFTYV